MTEPLIITKSQHTGTDVKTNKKTPNTVSDKAMLAPLIQSISFIHICGGCHPEGFIVASFYNLSKANNHYNNNNNNDNNNLSS